MRVIAYEALKEMSVQEIRDFVSNANEFKLTVTPPIGEHILAFLENEKKFVQSQRKLGDKWTYMLGGRHGFRSLGFLPLWSRAKMEGLEIQFLGHNADSDEFLFRRKK